jgi:predicted dehydrogenase
MERRNLALIGTAHVHTADNVRVAGEEGWRVAAVVDHDADRRALWAGRTGAAPHASMTTLNPDTLDATLVCGETAGREAAIMAALDAGLPVFTEKPMAPDGATARRLADHAARCGHILHTGYFMRFDPALNGLRHRLRDGAIGTVTAARMRFSHDGAYADWLDIDGWMTNPVEASYGGFADEAVHCVDWLIWTLGPVARESAMLGSALGRAVDDHGAALLHFESGATAVVEAGWTDTRMRLELDIVAEDGGACLHDGRISLWRRGAAPHWQGRMKPLDAGDGVRPFLRAVAGGCADRLVPPDEAASVNAVMDKLYGRA